MPRSRSVRIGLALLVLGEAPLLPTLLAWAVMAAAGCPIDEKAPRACPVLGHDVGTELWHLLIFGYFTYVTFPLAVLGAALLAIAAARRLARRPRGR